MSPSFSGPSAVSGHEVAAQAALEALLSGFGRAPRRWPRDLAPLRFLPQGAFQGVWLWLVWQLSLQSRRSETRLAALWQLAELKLGPLPEPHPEAEPALPCEAALWLIGDYIQAWGRLDYWEGWLRSYYAPTAVLGHLCRAIPTVPGWRPATRKRLLELAIRLLAPTPSAMTHIASLGELAAAASALGQGTQAELLLDEMALLLSRLPAEELPGRALELGLEWLRHGQARRARFALQLWQRGLRELSAPAQLDECERVLSRIEALPGRGLSLEAFSLLHGWLQRVGEHLLRAPACREPLLLLRLLRLGWRLGLPEADAWQAALGFERLSPVSEAALGAYTTALEPWCESLAAALIRARATVATLPAWLRRWGAASAAPLHTARLTLAHGLAPELQSLSLQMQTAGLLLAAATGKRHQARRARLRAWGQACFAALLAACRQEPELSDRLAESLADWLELADQAAGPSEAAEAASEDLPPGWGRWRLLLATATAAARAGRDADALWRRLLTDWAGLDAYEQLQAIAAMSLALAGCPPAAQRWFGPLCELAEQVDAPWRARAVAAVGQGRIRGGDLRVGLGLLARIEPPGEQLQALLQVAAEGSGPELAAAILASARRQQLSRPAWQGHLAVALALRQRGQPAAGLAVLAQGLVYLL